MEKSLFRFLFFYFLIHSGIAQNSSIQSSKNYKLEQIEERIDSIMNRGIREKAFPGAQLLVAHKGDVIFHKTYGFRTYDRLRHVDKKDVYDLASVTKIAGPLLALMKLYEDGKIDLDKPFSDYWKPWKRRKDKRHISLRELLAHQSGLQAYIVFLEKATRNGEFKRRFLRTSAENGFSRQVYRDIYVKDRFERKIFRTINRSPVSSEKKYLYSGMASLIYPKLIERLTAENYITYLRRNFYDPLGCTTLGYRPSLNDNLPYVQTEEDSLFRKDIVQGWVHDENAALFGGVSGNAGLFGTAQDLFRLMQMLVDKGEFNGRRYFKEETVAEFTRIQYPENENRRGLGFDKPLIGNDTLSLRKSYPAPEVSSSSFGHSGFTGTFVWADPEHQLVFIFLSNRVYPTRNNRNLYNLNIRPALQQAFYQGLFNQNNITNN